MKHLAITLLVALWASIALSWTPDTQLWSILYQLSELTLLITGHIIAYKLVRV